MKVGRVSAIATVIALGLASSVTAGTTTLAFEHSHNTTIVEYRALVGLQPGAYTEEYSLGLPAASGTLFSVPLEIPDNVEVFVAVVAVDDRGLRSAPSNERVRVSQQTTLGMPGQPLIAAD
ncbi:MAG: hypothetical protein VX246_07240 [Myxococcota bacterium]|nr:hypothetical protein [Myxococcota bacterium]